MGQSIDPEIIEQYTFHMAKWQVDLIVVLTPSGPYLLIRQMCGVLGVANVGQMLQRMREDDLLPDYMHQWPVQTRGGRQPTWCIHKEAVGYWLAFINTAKVRKEFRPRLKALKRQCLEFINREFWGEVDSSLMPVPVPMDVSVLAQQTHGNTEDIQHTQGLLLLLEDRIGALEEQVHMPISDDE